MLEPFLQQVCQGQLSEIRWFRTDWQRGGAATGYATFTEQGIANDVVVKLPVPPRERRWLEILSTHVNGSPSVGPKLYAHGESIGGYDLAWVVMEHLPHGPLSSAWDGQEFDLLVEAIGRFYQVSSHVPLSGKPRERDWQAMFERARKHVADGAVADPQRWKNALKKTHKKLDEWIAVWDSRPIEDWRHGDLHLGNAMTREPAPQGPAVLLDFAEVEPGCWIEDAVYFEHLYWASKQRLGGRKLAKAVAHARRDADLPVASDWADLANVFRALQAMATPAGLSRGGNEAYVASALEVLERSV